MTELYIDPVLWKQKQKKTCTPPSGYGQRATGLDDSQILFFPLFYYTGAFAKTAFFDHFCISNVKKPRSNAKVNLVQKRPEIIGTDVQMLSGQRCLYLVIQQHCNENDAHQQKAGERHTYYVQCTLHRRIWLSCLNGL